MDRVLLHHRRENNKIFIFYKKFVSFFFLVGVIKMLVAFFLTLFVIYILQKEPRARYPSRDKAQIFRLQAPRACTANNNCALNELCIQHDDGTAGHCMQSCNGDKECGSGACGRFTAKKDAPLICCPSGKTSNYAGYDYCTQAPEGSTCWSDATCDGAGQCAKDVCTDPPDVDLVISGCMAECEDEDCNTVCSDSGLATFTAWAAGCAIKKASVRGTCTSSCDDSDPARPPGAVCVYGAWCKPERVHKTPTGETLCCPENTYYDAKVNPEGCIPFAICSPDRVHMFRGEPHCCPQESYYDESDDTCLPYSRCKDKNGKMMICPIGKKCDSKNHVCI